MNVDLLTIGDPTIDTFVKIHDAHLALRLHPDRTELCINYADKIPVDELHRTPAGNSVNAVLAAARLGVRTATYGVTGDDSDGHWIRQELEAAGVDTSLMAFDPGQPTNASTALVFHGERTLFVLHQARHYRLPKLPQTAWIYATSLGPRSPSMARLHASLLRNLQAGGTAKLAFSPGSHQLRMGARALGPLLRASDLLLLNREEAEDLTARRSGDPKELLRGLFALGPRTVVMTDGIRGSYAFDGAHFLRAGILKMPVVDRTGAGDSYGATVVAALLLGHDLATAMAWGTAQAAFVVSALGTSRGLVGRRRLEGVVRRHPDLPARRI